MGLTRRSFLKAGVTAGAVGMISASRLASAKRGSRKGRGSTNQRADAPFRFTPFTQELFIPNILQPFPLDPEPGHYPGPRFRNQPGGPAVPRGNFNDVAHGIAPEFDGRVPGFPCPDWNNFSDATHEVAYKLITEETTQQFFPGVDTPVFTYRDANQPPGSGRTPGPTVVADYRKPIVVRNENHLTADRHPVNTTGYDVETSIHLHGTHAPAHADGYPEFYVLAGEARDYFYPNISPRRTDPERHRAPVGEGDFDTTWIPSTLWYHDHAMDITGFNVSRGLAGFYLVFDEREKQLIADRVLPNSFDVDDFGNPLDIGLALTDQAFHADGTLAYDFLDHNGRIGDVFTVNGTVQPFLRVQRRKYRFRILNASNARVYQLRLSSRQPFLVMGADSWLFPRAGWVNHFELAAAQRHDVIIDFRHAPDAVFLENIMIQEDGRKGKGVDPRRPTPLLKFVVEGSPIADEVTVTDGTPIRGVAGLDPDGQWSPIRADEIVATREFRFERANGGWVVNNRFFNPRRADALPELGTAERWFIRNNSGGWWHPFHLHLEGFQIQAVNGRRPPFERSFNVDTVNGHGGEVAEVFAKFRTFTGPFVFHCHAIEHEDMRMMAVHDPRPAGARSPLDGESRLDPEVSGVMPDCADLEAEERIFFNVAGDVDPLEDRGVGFPDCTFDLDRRGNRG